MKNEIHMLAPVGMRQMNSFIITTEDGHVIVVDGGFREDAAKLLDNLRRLSGREVPHIDAWVLSHAHCDHIDAFMEIMEHTPEAVTVEKVYCHFPSIQFIQRGESWEAHTVEEFYALLPRFADKLCVVSVGDHYEIGEAAIDVLYTADPAYTNNTINNSSMVFRLTLGTKKVLFLGDLGVEAGKKLFSQYGDALKSDYVQMAHHGQGGVGRDVYAAIAPRGCLWCTPQWLWDNDIGKGYNTHVWRTVETRGWMQELGVEEHYVIKDGDQTLTL